MAKRTLEQRTDEPGDRQKQPAEEPLPAIDAAIGFLQARYTNTIIGKRGVDTIKEAYRIECARSLDLSDDADWDKIRSQFDEKDRVAFAHELQVDPQMTWEQMEATRTRPEWELYAYDHGVFSSLSYTFDGMRHLRWDEFSLRNANKQNIRMDKFAIMSGDDDRIKHMRKYGSFTGYSDEINERILRDAHLHTIETQHKNPMMVHSMLSRALILQRQRVLLDDPSLKESYMEQNADVRKKYAKLLGLRSGANVEEIAMWEHNVLHLGAVHSQFEDTLAAMSKDARA